MTDLRQLLRAGAADEVPTDPIPADTEALVDWIDRRFPEETPRYSSQECVDNALRRAGIRELIAHLRMKLAELQHDAAEELME